MSIPQGGQDGGCSGRPHRAIWARGWHQPGAQEEPVWTFLPVAFPHVIHSSPSPAWPRESFSLSSRPIVSSLCSLMPVVTALGHPFSIGGAPSWNLLCQLTGLPSPALPPSLQNHPLSLVQSFRGSGHGFPLGSLSLAWHSLFSLPF